MSQASPNYATLLRSAAVELKDLKARLDRAERGHNEPVAIVGMACRFPGGANNPALFWDLLDSGKCAVREVPADRWNIDEYYDPDPSAPGKMNTRYAAFLDQVDRFDPYFFGISPRECACMDPQQRLFLEVAWEALEDAGQPTEALKGSLAGVFVGAFNNDYAHMQLANPASMDIYSSTGTGCAIAGRLSYLLDLRGPCVAIDTACSSSLTAVHLACQSLRLGESDLAVAGGVNLILSPLSTVALSKLQALAPDGLCKTFDARADGMARAEGCGVIVLKRLSAALANHDRIHAVVRGSAVNQDGRGSSFTSPNALAQREVMRRALTSADIQPSRVSYIEAHGTGTALGDPIEMEALKDVYGQHGQQHNGNHCAIGSVKTNLGHLEAASGMAGLIKTVLSLKHEHIPPHLHFRTLNPHISLEGTGFVIPTEGQPWPRGNEPRIAGVSAFGLNGTNVHVLIEESPASVHAARAESAGIPLLLPLSAHSAVALSDLARQYKTLLDSAGHPDSLYDLCYTASARRSHHDYRLAVTGSSRQDLSAGLKRWLQNFDPAKGKTPARPGGLVFVFAPHGSQWLGMGRNLLSRSAVFRQTIERCGAIIQTFAGWSLLDHLQGSDAEWLDRIDRLQPALFALQLALAEHWRAWGIVPDAVVGHSMGETAAACFAGGLSLEDAVRIACRRSQLLSEVSGQGAMAVVELPFDAAQRELRGYEGRLAIAVSNSPRSTVLAGDPSALEEVCDRLQERGIFCGWGVADVASHSPQMKILAQTLAHDLRDLSPRSLAIPFYSAVTLSTGKRENFGAQYWVQNLCQPVLFGAAMERLIKDGHRNFIELSPHPILFPAIEDWLKQSGQTGHLLASMRRNDDDAQVSLESLGSLYELGWPIDWGKVYPQPGRVLSLPAYPWQRERFWIDPRPAARPVAASSGHPFLERHLEAGDQAGDQAGRHYWETEIDLERFPYLADHRVQGLYVLPAVVYLEMALAAGRQSLGSGPLVLKDIRFERPLILPDGKAVTLQLVLAVAAKGQADFQVLSRTQGELKGEPKSAWVLHARGLVSKSQLTSPQKEAENFAPDASPSEPGSAFYSAVGKLGFDFGPSFRGIAEIWRKPGEAVARLQFPKSVTAQASRYVIHPAVLDSGLQTVGVAASDWLMGTHSYLPARLESITVFDTPPEGLFAHARLDSESSADAFAGDVTLRDGRGHVFAKVQGLAFQRFEPAIAENFHDWFYHVRWIPKPPSAPAQGPGIGMGVGAGSRVLILSNPNRAGVALQRALETRGISSTLADSDQALQEPFGAVIDLRSLESHEDESMSVADLRSGQSIGSLAVLRLVQAMADAGWREPPQLWLVTRGAQPVGEPARLGSVGQSGIWGLARTISHEYPEFACKRVDLDPSESAGDEMEMLALWISESTSEDQIAIRSGECYVPRLNQLATQNFALPETAAALRPDATYLITGGLGGLGFEIAKWMLEHGARNLVLVGRSAASPEKQAYLDDYRDRGARIQIAQADAASWEQMSGLMREIERDLPPLRGVVHSAVVLDDGVLIHQDEGRFRKVFAPKMDGAWILHQLTRLKSLDFFVLFSSGGSLLGSPGDASYAAANAFLDALAHYRQGLGLPGMAINWGAWSGVGLGAESALRGERMAARGGASMSPRQGVEIFGRLLGSAIPQIGVMQLNFRQWQEFYPRAAQSPVFAEMRLRADVSSRRGATLRSRLLEAPMFERREVLEEQVRTEICAVLRIAPERVGADTPLRNLGFDSLLAVELRNRLENVLDIALPVTLVWGFPTLGALAPQLAARLDVPLVDVPLEEAQPAAPEPSKSKSIQGLLDGLATLSEEAALTELRAKKREAGR